MMHKTRRWSVMPIEQYQRGHPDLEPLTPAGALAKVLTKHSWCSCNGFSLGGLAYLNDQTSGDGAAEFGVVRLDTLRQVETITFGWCTEEKARHYIDEMAPPGWKSEFGDWDSGITRAQIQTPAEHGTCGNCA